MHAPTVVVQTAPTVHLKVELVAGTWQQVVTKE